METGFYSSLEMLNPTEGELFNSNTVTGSQAKDGGAYKALYSIIYMTSSHVFEQEVWGCL